MKNFKVLLAGILLTGLSLSSCSSDDDNSATSASIVGKWTPTKTVSKVNGQTALNNPYEGNEAGCDKDFIEFTQAGALNNTVYFHNARMLVKQAREQQLLMLNQGTI
ncbi:hypothetical protein [Flavobacterium sp. 3HN19-14]|uniref:hypothetical protein n=1 Tax=Flavobacterium sp. 3HN19-14 TaxID=3448133 RepID=UPI003EE1C0EB